MRILGIDPGFDRTGFGVIDQRGSEATWVYHGCVQTRAGQDFGHRLQQMRDAIQTVIKQYQPSAAAVEKLFFQTNVKTAIQVGMARGVIMLALTDAGLPIVEMTPSQLKQGVTNWGGAGKKQVGEMVKRLLKLKDIPTPDDAADALAIAIVGGLLHRSQK